MIIQWIVLVCFLALLLHKARFVSWNYSYITKETTSSINGFFICIVFMRHFFQYCSYASVDKFLGQLIVVMFLFYSGFGCAAQYLKHGKDYLHIFPIKRVLSTLVNFDIAICVFIFVDILVGKHYSFQQVVFSFVGWDHVGNSAWYIFAILACYLSFYLAYVRVDRIGKRNAAVLLAFIIGSIVLVLSHVKARFWYDTMMVFAAGVGYGIYQDKLESLFKKGYWFVGGFIFGAIFIIPFIPYVATRHYIAFNLQSVLFAFFVVMVTMKLRIDSPAMRWCGNHLFPLYIYQRIPMIVFSALHPAAFRDWRSWIYFALSGVITIGIAMLYPRISVSFCSRVK